MKPQTILTQILIGLAVMAIYEHLASGAASQSTTSSNNTQGVWI